MPPDPRRALGRIRALVAADVRARFDHGDKQAARYIDQATDQDLAAIERALDDRDRLAGIVAQVPSQILHRALDRIGTEEVRNG